MAQRVAKNIGRLLSIIWLFIIVVISTKFVGEERLDFREQWYKNCLISENNKTSLKQSRKRRTNKDEVCFTQARQASLKQIPDYILVRKVGLWGILPILIFWIIGLKIAKRINS